MIDAKSPFTASHSRGVAAYAGMIGGELGFSRAGAAQLHRAGLLHDIGKLGIPNTILDKPAKLSDEEFARIRLHPELHRADPRGHPGLRRHRRCRRRPPRAHGRPRLPPRRPGRRSATRRPGARRSRRLRRADRRAPLPRPDGSRRRAGDRSAAMPARRSIRSRSRRSPPASSEQHSATRPERRDREAAATRSPQKAGVWPANRGPVPVLSGRFLRCHPHGHGIAHVCARRHVHDRAVNSPNDASREPHARRPSDVEGNVVPGAATRGQARDSRVRPRFSRFPGFPFDALTAERPYRGPMIPTLRWRSSAAMPARRSIRSRSRRSPPASSEQHSATRPERRDREAAATRSPQRMSRAPGSARRATGSRSRSRCGESSRSSSSSPR